MYALLMAPSGGAALELGQGLLQGEVRVEMTEAHARQRSDLQSEQRIEELWAAKLATNPRMFDASKFRLADMELVDGRLTLRIGLTSYKDYVGTNLRPEVELRTLIARGESALGGGWAGRSARLGGALLLGLRLASRGFACVLLGASHF